MEVSVRPSIWFYCSDQQLPANVDRILFIILTKSELFGGNLRVCHIGPTLYFFNREYLKDEEKYVRDSDYTNYIVPSKKLTDLIMKTRCDIEGCDASEF